MLSNRTTRWSLATGLVCAVLVAATWFLLIGPRRSEAANLREQTVAAEQANELLRQRTVQLRAQLDDLPERRQELAAIARQLPKQADVPTLVRDLRRISDSSGVVLTTVTPGEAQYLDPTTGQPAVAATPGATSPLVSIPLNVVADGDFFEVALFMKQVQTEMRRSILITSVAVEQGQDEAAADGASGSSGSGSDGTVSLTMTGQVFVYQPDAAVATAAVAGVAGVAPAGGEATQ